MPTGSHLADTDLGQVQGSHQLAAPLGRAKVADLLLFWPALNCRMNQPFAEPVLDRKTEPFRRRGKKIRMNIAAADHLLLAAIRPLRSALGQLPDRPHIRPTSTDLSRPGPGRRPPVGLLVRICIQTANGKLAPGREKSTFERPAKLVKPSPLAPPTNNGLVHLPELRIPHFYILHLSIPPLAFAQHPAS